MAPFVLGGNLGCAGGQVAHVTLTGSHGVLGPQVPGDHRGLMGDSTMTRLLVGDIPAFSVDVM